MAQASRLCMLDVLVLCTGETPVPPGVDMAVMLEPIEDFQQIEIDRSSSPNLGPEEQRLIEDAWAGLCAQSPRYFDGQMLAYESISFESGTIMASVRPYSHHAVRDTIDLGVSLLAVTAILVADEHVLLGKRSVESHRYGGLWELGPSGGVDVPESGNRIDRSSLLDEAIRETEEEAGFTPNVQEVEVVALIHDRLVGSTDIAIILKIEKPTLLDPNWEYDDTRWVTLDELWAWVNENPDDLIPTTVALARYLHESSD